MQDLDRLKKQLGKLCIEKHVASEHSPVHHGSIEFIAIPAEDAKYMLISCSAFVNHLVEKWSGVVR